MTKYYYLQRKQNLDKLFENVKKFKDDEEIAAHLSRYLCVLVSGYIEVSVREIVYTYAQNKSHEYVANFVQSNLKRLRNPKMENILQLVGSFSQTWRDSIQKSVEGELKDAVDSVVSNRNQIAHGGDVGITYGQINYYYNKSVEVIKLLERLCC